MSLNLLLKSKSIFRDNIKYQSFSKLTSIRQYALLRESITRTKKSWKSNDEYERRPGNIIDLKKNPSKLINEKGNNHNNNNYKKTSASKGRLPFAERRKGFVYGTLVTDSDKLTKTGKQIDVILSEDLKQKGFRSKLYGRLDENDIENENDHEYEFEEGDRLSSRERRVHPDTLYGRGLRGTVTVPEEISKHIGDVLLRDTIPGDLRLAASRVYVSLHSESQKASTTEIEAKAQIAGLFIQDYAMIYRVLSDLKKLQGRDWLPNKVLDVGFGPSTGLAAFNELFKDEIVKTNKSIQKESLIFGVKKMQSYAKDILNTQKEAEEKFPSSFLDHFPKQIARKSYNLIIASHQLLSDENKFPYGVDDLTEILLKYLEPNGIIIFAERGTPEGFECISRARQFMIRPENHDQEMGKIPRPYLRGERRNNLQSTIDDIEPEAVNIEQVAPEQTATENDPKTTEKIEETEIEAVETEETTEAAEETVKGVGNFNLRVLAPSVHHHVETSQLSDLEVYKAPGANKLKWVKFTQAVNRPKFTLELKKGAQLATEWETPDSGYGKKGLASGGSGRPGGLDYEVASFSYLVVERMSNEIEVKKEIKRLREDKTGELYKTSFLTPRYFHWPRIIDQPNKRGKHVNLVVSTIEGTTERWTIPKSFGNQQYHDARKACSGDLWPLGAKTKVLCGAQNAQIKIKIEKREAEKAKRQQLRKEREEREGKINNLASKGIKISDEVLRELELIQDPRDLSLIDLKLGKSVKDRLGESDDEFSKELRRVQKNMLKYKKDDKSD